MIDDYKAIIDIGTSKIAVIVGEYNAQTKELNILGFGKSKSDGIKNGVVVDIEIGRASCRERVYHPV